AGIRYVSLSNIRAKALLIRGVLFLAMKAGSRKEKAKHEKDREPFGDDQAAENPAIDAGFSALEVRGKEWGRLSKERIGLN
ncbi:hypothetical protein, partial [Bacillus pumilus]|uniref:hypothetical protein n=2 Tax=Bacillaceae TaxID=186817 RepID=UPI003D1B1635